MTILVTDPYYDKSLLKLNSKFKVIHTNNKSEVTKKIKSAHGLLIRSKTIVGNELLTKAKSLKFVATATSGLDHINLELCKAKHIQVFNPKEVNSISAAEHSFALLLSLCKKLNQSSQSIANFNWKNQLSRGLDLNGKTIGIIGLGRVGSKVARMSLAFNMKVQAYDPYKNDDYFSTHSTLKIHDLNQLIQTSDIISIHTPLTQETKYIVNESNLKLVNPNTVLINTSRGLCINEKHLISALKDKSIKAAALDVFEHEPILTNNELLSLDNVLLSPHIGVYTEEAFKSASFECTNWLYDKLIQLNS